MARGAPALLRPQGVRRTPTRAVRLAKTHCLVLSPSPLTKTTPAM
ncbi:hypothetical protein PC116_g15173 [Phytophthora cactorum]|uniref:Uncharacterized protein n=1 Tax=Phytophthora cactorum TaxID=29920 RepID=A0A8T1KI63_9STRA|nr:hypothetical protein PC114_g12500 [Phytophthora cactorum]KAG2936772.1 hypothetical protein PC117_g11959 [Phytophthora cactorum]KAG3020216.1 hypothetical protein PC120_g9392 [Phytophthora cactorum]KAG3163954.1 hypothetical protein C6341_g12809 [Phytophthora cactorum]KAG4047542.1 hypothetical protein PC123_g17102 [Phytophthora cactorum]